MGRLRADNIRPYDTACGENSILFTLDNRIVGDIALRQAPDFALVKTDGSWNGAEWVAALESTDMEEISGYSIYDWEETSEDYPCYGDLVASFTP